MTYLGYELDDYEDDLLRDTAKTIYEYKEKYDKSEDETVKYLARKIARASEEKTDIEIKLRHDQQDGSLTGEEIESITKQIENLEDDIAALKQKFQRAELDAITKEMKEMSKD